MSMRWALCTKREDGVGVGGVTDQVMPFGDRQLAGDQGGPSVISIFEDFEQIVTRLGVERFQAPVVEDEQVGGAQGFQPPVEGAGAVGERQLVEELGRSHIEDGVVIPASFVPKCTRQPALADASWPFKNRGIQRRYMIILFLEILRVSSAQIGPCWLSNQAL